MFAIRMTFSVPPPPVTGWALDGVKVATYDTPEEADKAMHKLRRDTRYSWSGCKLAVAEVKEGKRRKSENALIPSQSALIISARPRKAASSFISATLCVSFTKATSSAAVLCALYRAQSTRTAALYGI